MQVRQLKKRGKQIKKRHRRGAKPSQQRPNRMQQRTRRTLYQKKQSKISNAQVFGWQGEKREHEKKRIAHNF